LLYIMVAAAFVSAACWLFLEPDRDAGTRVRNKPAEPLALGDAAPPALT
jgi:hypothetical protein